MFFLYPMGEYVFSMWCKFGATMPCTKKSGQCLLGGFVYMPMAVINDSCSEFV